MRRSTAILSVFTVAVTLSIFTQLRVSFFGFGEILILALFLTAVMYPTPRSAFSHFVFTRFWIAYLSIATVGAAVNQTMLGENSTSTPKQIIFDYGAYTFVLLTCLTFEKLRATRLLDPARFLTRLYFVSAITLTVLFILSFFRPAIFGFTLRYHAFFAPLVDNVHQASMYIVTLPFIGTAVATTQKGWKRVLSIVLALSTVLQAISTNSTKAFMALVVGTLVLLHGYLIGKLRRPLRVPVLGLYLVTALVVVLSVVTLETWTDVNVVRMAREGFSDADPVGARQSLYSEALHVIEDSPIVGHGPGPHLLYRGFYWDVHQTQFAILLQTGLLGFAAYLAFMLRVVRRLLDDPPVLAALSAVMVYSAGGDVLRRLPIWIVVLCLYYSRTTSEELAADPQASSPAAIAV
jgi:O-antigen ligase